MSNIINIIINCVFWFILWIYSVYFNSNFKSDVWASECQQFRLPLAWLRVKLELGSLQNFGCFLRKILCLPPSYSILQWLMVWGGGWTRRSHQAALGEFLHSGRPSPPRLCSLPAALSLTSFYRLILATALCVVRLPSSFTLSPSICERDTWQTLSAPLSFHPSAPLMSSFYTCVCGRLPLLSSGEFSHWAQTEGLFQLCLHKDLTFCLLTRSHVGSTGAGVMAGLLKSFFF